jgi:hypothetical protein
MEKQTKSASSKSSRTSKVSGRGNGSNNAVKNTDLSNLEQVRDLLFGHDLAQLRSQLNLLDDKFNEAIQVLEKSMAVQFKKQHQAIQSLTSTISVSLEKESNQRQSGLEKLKQDLQSSNKTSQQMIQQAADEAATAEEQLRSHLSLLESGVEQAFSEINHKLDNTETHLDGSKTDRTLLVSLFKTMASEIEKGRQ